MPLPPVVHYRLVRLKALGRPFRRPAVWGSLAALGVVAVAVPQYLRHPEWRSQYAPAVDSPAVDPGTGLGALTSKDLAELAEIDNLALLLNQLQPTTSIALDAPAADPARLALPQATPEEGAASPFAQYLERSRFRFSPATNGGSGVAAGEPLGSDQRQPSSSTSPDATPPSPLQQALSERLSSGSAPALNSEPSSAAKEPAAPTSGLTPPPWMVEGQLPGVDQRFIRTTPQMSPPSGTTGYTPPPSLSPSPAPSAAIAAPPQGAIAPAGLNLNFSAPVTAPAASGQRPPQLGTDNITAPPQPAPVPFSAPRPPGVYTGNGYINTFADPSEPVD